MWELIAIMLIAAVFLLCDDDHAEATANAVVKKIKEERL